MSLGFKSISSIYQLKDKGILGVTSAKITTGLASSEQDITSELIDFVLLITGRSDDYEDDVIEAVGVEFFDERENEEKMSLRQSFLLALGKALEEHCLPWKEVNLSEGFSSAG